MLSASATPATHALIPGALSPGADEHTRYLTPTI
jgi:hypothetical protein